MRIGLFSDMYLPHVSGVTNHVRLYKRYFEDQGHEVFLCTFGDLDYSDDEPNIIRTRGIEWGETGWSVAPHFNFETRALIPTLDVAHVHHPFQSGRLLVPLVTRHDIPLIFTNHTRYDLYSDSYAPFIPHNIRYGALRAALAWFLDHCSLVIAPSQSIAQWLTEFALYEDATAIPNGIDVTMFESPSALTRSDIGLDEDAFIFCYTGRIAPEKNTLYLLDELRQACQTAPSIQLLIVGDGPDHDCFLQYVEENGLVDRVICAGMIPYEDISSYEQLADAFVTGSISEVHPLVVLEAMAARLPVIAIDSPGIRETVMHNVNGLIAPQVEPGALAELMIRIAQDDSLCERLAQGARETIGHFTLEKTAGRVLDEYERLRVS